MVPVSPVRVRDAETLTWRARHNSIEPISDAGKVTDVTTSDFVCRLNDDKSSRCECTIQQTNSGEEGKNKLVHGISFDGISN